jgi:hypothetical protein
LSHFSSSPFEIIEEINPGFAKRTFKFDIT